MSKKSRKRNKKILAALALAGGAAMLAKGRKGAGAVTGVVNPNLSKASVAADVATDVAQDVAPAVKSRFLPRVHPGTLLNERAALPGAGVEGPPSILNPYKPPRTHRMRGMNYKGGGIAKRGTGAAYKSGGRVKSMGIAKRGGGIAKR